MPNIIDADGIHTESYQESYENLVNALKGIYGEINTESNSPDGQAIGIYTQGKQDILDLAVSMYNCLDPDKCDGNAQDILYKLNGLIRKASKFTFVRVNISTNKSVNLKGLDADVANENATAFTVSDTNGNQYYLVNSQTLPVGVTTCEFRAAKSGAIEVTPNSITNLVTVILGVESAINPGKEYSKGSNRETNAEFRIRRAKSTAAPSQGFNDGLEAQILNINEVTDVIIDNNRTNVQNANGTPAHTIWVIVEGGTDEEIAQAIYRNVTDGCGMRGTIKVPVQKKNGRYEDIYFDRVQLEKLYIKANIKNTGGSSNIIDVNLIEDQLIKTLTFRSGNPINSSDVNCLLKSFISGGYPYDVKLSLNNSTWVDLVTPSSIQKKFYLTADTITLTVS